MMKKQPAAIKEFLKSVRAVQKPLCLSIVSLGNPNRQFSNTRHNAGHMVLNAVKSEMVGLGPYTETTTRGSSIVTTFDNHPDLILFESGSYMNESGKAVKTMIDWWRTSSSGTIDPSDPAYVHTMLVLHDDLDLDLGEVKFKSGGKGSHGHNGLRSIMDLKALDSAPNYLSATSFPRMRIGIGRPDRGDVASFVLKKFRPDEKSIIQVTTIPEVIDILTQLFYSGLFKSFQQ